MEYYINALLHIIVLDVFKKCEFSYIDGRIEEQLIKVADTFITHKRLKAASKIKTDSIDTLISSIEDAFDAMTSDRAYRKALTVSNAIDLLKE